jgi:low temperature requirement protein LtrA
MSTDYNLWWGPPKKISAKREERKISWLELFYDLVYVIAIARITHHLSEHLNFSGFLDYTYVFGMIFWGWFNGSFHHDLHGTTGLRTNLMTLWQMMIVAALIVTLSSPPEKLIFNATIAVIAMQVFITYLWWSVGLYDKEHRQLNKPYTFCYLIALGLLFLTFFNPPYMRIIFYLSLLLNYLPAFIIIRMSKEREKEFSLSSSMTERLGLFTIILFGEVVSGVIKGMSEVKELEFKVWINFGLAILIIFAAWWIFFSMIADRQCNKGFRNSYLMILTYIPTLMSLGMIGVSFSQLLPGSENPLDGYFYWIKIAFGVSLSVFIFGIIIISRFLNYPLEYRKFKRNWMLALFTAAVLFLVITILNFPISLFVYLLIVLLILLAVIFVISKNLIVLQLNDRKDIES